MKTIRHGAFAWSGKTLPEARQGRDADLEWMLREEGSYEPITIPFIYEGRIAIGIVYRHISGNWAFGCHWDLENGENKRVCYTHTAHQTRNQAESRLRLHIAKLTGNIEYIPATDTVTRAEWRSYQRLQSAA